MAAAVAMELDQCETSKKTAGALAISKSSGSRISKPNSGSTLRKNPIVQQQQQQQQQQQGGGGNKPAPTSKVYNTDPMSFRHLVQQLTGCDPAPAPPPPPPPPTAPVQSFSSQLGQPQLQPIQQQPQIEVHNLPQYHHHQQQQQMITFPDPAAMLQQGSPTSGGGGGGFSSGARPVNTRLQRMAPPPLRPTFSFSLNKLQQQVQPQQQQQHQQGQQGQDPKSQSEISSPGAHPLSPISKRVSPMPLLSFSPLPVLSPTDNAWASFESPNTAAMKQLAQSILEGKSSSTISGRFPWSPLGLPSPGLMPELFPDVKMIDSPQQDSATAATTTADFSFPELRDS